MFYKMLSGYLVRDEHDFHSDTNDWLEWTMKVLKDMIHASVINFGGY